jgi:hypothetical protein
MRLGFKIISILLISFLFCSFACAQTDITQKSKKANKNSVLGLWRMTYQIVNPKIKNSSLFFAEYQVFNFDNDGYVKNVASKDKISAKDIKIFIETMPKKSTYSFIDDGLLVIKRSEKDADNIVISIITQDMQNPVRQGAPLMKKGDLILSYLDLNKQLYMQRFLRKLELPDSLQ